MEERRLLLAVALSLVVLTGYSLLFAPAHAACPCPSPRRPPQASAARAGAGLDERNQSAARSGGCRTAAEAAAAAAAAATLADDARAPGRGERARATSSRSRTGVPVSCPGRCSRTRTRAADAEELVAAQTTSVRPLDVETGDAPLDARLRGALFQPSATELPRRGRRRPRPCASATPREASRPRRTVTFRARGLLGVRVFVKRNGQALPVRVLWGPGLGNPSPEEREVRGYTEPQAVALSAAGSRPAVGARQDRGGRPVARAGALGGRREPVLRGAVRRARRRRRGAGPRGDRCRRTETTSRWSPP